MDRHHTFHQVYAQYVPRVRVPRWLVGRRRALSSCLFSLLYSERRVRNPFRFLCPIQRLHSFFLSPFPSRRSVSRTITTVKLAIVSTSAGFPPSAARLLASLLALRSSPTARDQRGQVAKGNAPL